MTPSHLTNENDLLVRGLTACSARDKKPSKIHVHAWRTREAGEVPKMLSSIITIRGLDCGLVLRAQDLKSICIELKSVHSLDFLAVIPGSTP